MKISLIFFTALFLSPLSQAGEYASRLLNGTTLEVVSASAAAALVPPGGVVIVSEQHGYQPHHQNQRTILQELALTAEGPISVGMEFFTNPYQDFVDKFLAGELTEAEFLKAADWGGDDFGNYRDQVLFPVSHGGKTLALNASRKLTSRVSKVGISNLTEEEKAMLPDGFALGNDNYRERFTAVMSSHVPAAALQRYFEAQSIWDDTMAVTAAEFLRANPTQRLVIIVGDFHAAYGGGLPDRLRVRGVKSITTISQVNTDGLTEDEAKSLIQVDEKYGARGDFVWVN